MKEMGFGGDFWRPAKGDLIVWAAHAAVPIAYAAVRLRAEPMMWAQCALAAAAIAYAVRRMLRAYAVPDAEFRAVLAAAVPLRAAVLRAADPRAGAFIALVCACFALERADRFGPLCAAIALCAVARPEGALVAVAFAVLFALRRSGARAGTVAAVGAAAAAVWCCACGWRTVFAVAYRPFAFRAGETLRWRPLSFLVENGGSIQQLRVVHSVLLLYAPVAFGGVSLVFSMFPVGVFVLVWAAFSLFINSEYVLYFMVPCQLLVYVLAFGRALRGKRAKWVALIFLFIYSIVYGVKEVPKYRSK